MKGCRALSESEVEAVLRSFRGTYRKRDRALFVLGIYTGFRISELLSLKVCDVYQNGRLVERVRVRRQNVKGKTEGRTVLLHPLAKRELLSLIQSMENLAPEAFLFASRKGSNAISRYQAWRILNRTFMRAGLTGQLGTHTMRKVYASRLWDLLGKDLVKLQRALGHKQITSTVSYLSFREEAIDEAILMM